MVVDIMAYIGSFIMIAAVVVLIIFYNKSQLVKENKELSETVKNLQIVNKNLAEYNETLLKDLKK